MSEWDGIIAIQKAKVKRYLYEQAYPNDIDKCRCCGVLFSLIQYPKGCPLNHKCDCDGKQKEQTK